MSQLRFERNKAQDPTFNWRLLLILSSGRFKPFVFFFSRPLVHSRHPKTRIGDTGPISYCHGASHWEMHGMRGAKRGSWKVKNDKRKGNLNSFRMLGLAMFNYWRFGEAWQAQVQTNPKSNFKTAKRKATCESRSWVPRCQTFSRDFPSQSSQKRDVFFFFFFFFFFLIFSQDDQFNMTNHAYLSTVDVANQVGAWKPLVGFS